MNYRSGKEKGSINTGEGTKNEDDYVHELVNFVFADTDSEESEFEGFTDEDTHSHSLSWNVSGEQTSQDSNDCGEGDASSDNYEDRPYKRNTSYDNLFSDSEESQSALDKFIEDIVHIIFPDSDDKENSKSEGFTEEDKDAPIPYATSSKMNGAHLYTDSEGSETESSDEVENQYKGKVTVTSRLTDSKNDRSLRSRNVMVSGKLAASKNERNSKHLEFKTRVSGLKRPRTRSYDYEDLPKLKELRGFSSKHVIFH